MNELENLREIHMPPPIPVWPPAPGWWILAVLLLTILAAIWLFYKRRKRLALQKAALAELEKLQKSLADGYNQSLFYTEISTLLRRLAIIKFSRSKVAGLTGKEWLKFLDETGRTDEFSNGAGQIIVTAPYSSSKTTIDDTDRNSLLTIVRNWILLNT